jgi:hypothetical protein
LYVPDGNPVIVTFVPDPVCVTSPGLLVRVHDPEEGKPLRATLPVETVQVGLVIVPTTGTAGIVFIDNVNVALTAEHSFPGGSFVETVIITFFPISEALGV